MFNHHTIFKFLLIFIPFFNSVLSVQNINQILEQIPQSDQKDLEEFFRLLIQKHEMGYTLFGPKPITVVEGLKISYQFPMIHSCYIREKGWRAWENNKHLFPTEYFELKKQERTGTTTFTSIYLINKKRTLEKVQKYLDLFKKNLGSNITAEEVLNRLCSAEPIQNILCSQFLLGIFFGYGENNAQTFERETEFYQTLTCKVFPPFVFEKSTNYPFCAAARQDLQYMKHRNCYKLPKNKTLFCSSLSEFDQLKNSRKDFILVGSEDLLDNFSSPGFVYWDEEEYKQLQQQYCNTRNILRVVYASGSFLKNTLKQWIMPHEK